jgi:hypothetical protein
MFQAFEFCIPIRSTVVPAGPEIRGRAVPVKPVTVTIDAVTHNGFYFVQGFMVYVASKFGAKSTQVGGSAPEELAKLLLWELVHEQKKSGGSSPPRRSAE